MRVLWSIGLLSAAIIAFQLALMQLLSIVQWYHFAYMVISVALLGFGTAGTVLSIFRKKLLANLLSWLYWLMMSAGISMVLVSSIAQAPAIRFDSYLLFTDFRQAGLLALTYLLFFIPFFLGALAIGLLFIAHADRIGKIYFANLSGSGIGIEPATAYNGYGYTARTGRLADLTPALYRSTGCNGDHCAEMDVPFSPRLIPIQRPQQNAALT
jgi:hypothetical protein